MAAERVRLGELRANASGGLSTKSMSIASCRWTPESTQSWSTFVANDLPDAATVRAARRAAVTCPKPLTPQRFSELQERSQIQPFAWECASKLCSDICKNRHLLKDAVLVFEDEGGEEQHWKFGTAFMRPFTAVLLPLTLLDVELPGAARYRHELEHTSSIDPTCIWSFDVQEVCVCDPFEDIDVSKVHVYLPTLLKAQSFLVCYSMPVPLESVLVVPRPNVAQRQHRAILKSVSGVGI
eukprot:841792-Amphidinium_carterae.4